jgi:hypothetical protein
MSRFPSLLPILSVLFAAGLPVCPAGAARYEYWPTADADDGQLENGAIWNSKPSASTPDDLLLFVGQENGTTYECALPFALTDIADSVADVRLRVNEQGGSLPDGLALRVSAALLLDPLTASPGIARFSLPRTSASAVWFISSPWDSSGQLVAKWEESPNLAPIVNEVVGQAGWGASNRVVHLFLEIDSAPDGNVVRFDDTHPRYPYGGNGGMRPARLIVAERFLDAFWGRELLCRPRPDRMELNLVPHTDVDLALEWGTASGSLPWSTAPATVSGGAAHHLVMDDLEPDTRYYYRVLTREAGQSSFAAGDEHSFRTLPAAGQPLRFAVTADMHVTNTSFQGYWPDLELLEVSLDHLLSYHEPWGIHFWIDLGDLVVIRATRAVLDEEETEQRYREARQCVERVAHSVPFLLVRGNHEEISGWGDDGSGSNDAIWSGRMLLEYFPTPVPDDFYSGNDTPHPGIGAPGNYFAFTAGNLRVRCGDPFLGTLVRPHNGHGEVNGSLDGWDWTLGEPQYRWLVDDLADHRTPFSLFAIHHLTSSYLGVDRYYGRGGIEVAKFAVAGRPTFEWGGEDTTGAYVLGEKRAAFDAGAPHDVLVAGGNQIVVKGHDHFSARQTLDGMIYRTVPKPDDTGARTGDRWGWRSRTFYSEEESIFHENSGFLAVHVDDEAATYEYVRTYPPAVFGQIDDSFTIFPDSTAFPSPKPTSSLVRKVWPNPFRHSVTIEYDIGRAGETTLSVHDVRGRLVRHLFRETMVPGSYDETWDGTDRNGRPVASGVYLARLRSGDRVQAQRMIVRR